MPKYVSLDYETSGLDTFSPTFEVRSCAIAWRNKEEQLKSAVYYGEEIPQILQQLKEQGHTLLVYNASFDIAITERFYKQSLPWVDVMRLRQLRARPDGKKGYQLKTTVSRFLPGSGGYEKEIKDWIKQAYPKLKKSEWGTKIHEAPIEILERYNSADAELTYRLFEQFTDEFETWGFDWTQDHEYYTAQVNSLISATYQGIVVDKDQLRRFIADTEAEIAAINKEFFDTLANEILIVREQLRQKKQAKFKKKVVTELPPFNTASASHLKALFCGVLGLTPAYKTKKGGPSFKSEHMPTWGIGGKILAKRGKRVIVMNQAKAILELSERDCEGKLRPMLKACGAVSGRMAGGSQDG